MQYLAISGIFKALTRIQTEANPLEHRTATAGAGIIFNTFKPALGYMNTPEQTQVVSRKRPDFVTEWEDRYIAFTEFKKKLAREKFENILDQLDTAIENTVDMSPDSSFAAYAIAMKGFKIAIYVYAHAIEVSESINDAYGCFIPLNQAITYTQFESLHMSDSIWPESIRERIDLYTNYLANLPTFSINARSDLLEAIGVESTPNMPRPHIFDMLNQQHAVYVQDMLDHMADRSKKPSAIFID